MALRRERVFDQRLALVIVQMVFGRLDVHRANGVLGPALDLSRHVLCPALVIPDLPVPVLVRVAQVVTVCSNQTLSVPQVGEVELVGVAVGGLSAVVAAGRRRAILLEARQRHSVHDLVSGSLTVLSEREAEGRRRWNVSRRALAGVEARRQALLRTAHTVVIHTSAVLRDR